MWLTVVTRDGGRRAYELSPGTITIGRSRECGVVLSDPKASRVHARVEVLADGQVLIEDAQSSNGTWLGPDRLASRRLLKPDEVVRIGGTSLFFNVSGVAAPQDDPAQAGARKKPSRQLVAIVASIVLIAGVAIRVTSRSPEGLIAAARDSVVLVTTRHDGQVMGFGTAWVLADADGLLVTNAHVVSLGEQISVTGEFGQLSARIVGINPCEDLAVLSADLPKGIDGLSLADQSKVKQGAAVIALGYPGDASLSSDLVATSGAVSVVRQTYNSQSVDVPNLMNVVQFTAPVNPGNSGGPLLTMDGKVLGVVSAGITEQGGRPIQGQGYAIGADQISDQLASLTTGATPGWTGAGLIFMDGQIIVAGVSPGSPAARSGVRMWDVLVRINGQRVGASLTDYCSLARGSEGMTQEFAGGVSVTG